MRGEGPPINPAVAQLKQQKWKEILQDVEAYTARLREQGLDARLVHPMLMRYAEYDGHHGPGFMLSREPWEDITGRIGEGKISRYELLITPKGWMRIMMVTLFSDEEKLAFVLPMTVEERHISEMRREASERHEMWLHLYNVRREYMSLPLYGAIERLGHEDDSRPEAEGEQPPSAGRPGSGN